MKISFSKSFRLSRILRLILGIAATVQGVMEHEFMLVLAGGLFSVMAIFNVGCWGAASCAIPQRKMSEIKPKDNIDEEMVK